MAVIDKYAAVNAALTAARDIHITGTYLRNLTGAVPFTTLRGRMDSMRDSYNRGIQPLLSLGTATQINPVVTTFYAGTLPTNPYTSLQAIGTTLLALYTAYDVVFDSLTPILHDAVTGHTYANIPLNQLSTLTDELDAVIAACAPLI